MLINKARGIHPEEFDRKMDDKATRREDLIDLMEEKKLLEQKTLREKITQQTAKFIRDFQSDDGEYPIDILVNILLVLIKEASIDLIKDALCEFAPSLYSRSICRDDIEKWLNKRGG